MSTVTENKLKRKKMYNGGKWLKKIETISWC